jgi:hypothetical protein
VVPSAAVAFCVMVVLSKETRFRAGTPGQLRVSDVSTAVSYLGIGRASSAVRGNSGNLLSLYLVNVRDPLGGGRGREIEASDAASGSQVTPTGLNGPAQPKVASRSPRMPGFHVVLFTLLGAFSRLDREL